jgi:exonuclease SbcC
VAIAKSKIKDIKDKVKKAKALEEETKLMVEEVSILDELVVAFGKDGIQAIIIDNSLPEIQEEINKFLGLLTDDRVTVDFITQKEKGKGKKTKSIETLDIVINDEYGSRTYETYSGGEKFRVDFSCHVGLAKFLAKRAGASVNFFIVDEGIGSQDEVAKEQFIKAAHQLTTVFDKVMVITHIPDIIDSFNHKIEVYKNQINGSKIRIVS